MGPLAQLDGTFGTSRGFRWLGFLAFMFVLGFVGAAATSAHEGHCEVEVSPRAGAGGTAFHFTGSGFTPTVVTVAGGSMSTVHELDLPDDDPWEFSIRSRTGDLGRWTATFADEDGCEAAVSFRVTLSDTDSAPLPVEEIGRVSGTAWAFVILVGLAAGLLIGHRVRFAIRP
jgi:hypothetical protein